MQQNLTAFDDLTRLGYLVVTDTIPNDGDEDVADALQQLIHDNPHRTIYFPDGIYTISHPIQTSANPANSVSLLLSNYATIRADPKRWKSDEAMIGLGGAEHYNDTLQNGSNYFLAGGIIDCSGIAKGVSIDSGRETVIRDLSIKRTSLGIHIKNGANSGSSDADIFDVNIIGNGASDSVGILVEGMDNTLSNIRIGGVQTGVHLISGANMLRNIHPLYQSDFSAYEDSCGFWDEGDSNRYDFCYSDHFRTGFRLKSGVRSFFHNCNVFWYNDGGLGAKYASEVFHCDGEFNSFVSVLQATFRDDRPAVVLWEGKEGGSGSFQHTFINRQDDLKKEADAYFKYLKQ